MEIRRQYIGSSCLLPVAVLIYFFNNFLLPQGVTLTLLLTPVWVYLLHCHGMLRWSAVVFVPLLAYTIIHLLLGVVLPDYIVSLTMLCCMVFFLLAGYLFIKNTQYNWDRLFKVLAMANFLLAVASVFCLFVPALKDMVWYMVPMSNNIKPIPRLKLFTYEASHLSFWMAPVAIYFYVRAFLSAGANKLFTVFIVSVPLLLSFSLGVIGGIIISGIPIFLLFGKGHFGNILLKQKGLIGVCVALLLLVALYRFFPGNPLFARLRNIATGADTSANGRTFQAFELAHKIIAQRSYWFGVGPGQLKILGRQIIIQYYNYITVPKAARIPNACAETIVYFGYVGFAIRMLAEVILFFTTKVYKSPFRLWIFLFVFIYQFTGSYVTNIAEYLIWMLSFTQMFIDLEYRAKDESKILSASSPSFQLATL